MGLGVRAGLSIGRVRCAGGAFAAFVIIRIDSGPCTLSAAGGQNGEPQGREYVLYWGTLTVRTWKEQRSYDIEFTRGG